MESYIGKNTKPWTKVGRHVSVVSSTSDEVQAAMLAARKSGEVLPEGYWISSDFQTEGRGRKGRLWEGEAGANIAVSLLLSTAGLPPAKLFTLSQNLALAVRDAVLMSLPGHRCEVKWPNDILLEGKKVAGILLESTLVAGRVAYVVAGIGLNVNQHFFSQEFNATSLAKTLGVNAVRRETVFVNLCEALQQRHERLRQLVDQGDTYVVQQEYHEALYGLGKLMQWQLASSQERMAARLKGVQPNGHIRLESDEVETAYSLDEVKLLREVGYVG